MLTGRQIREARKLLKMTAGALVRRTKVFKAAILQAESVNDEPTISVVYANAIQCALARAGIDFVTDDDATPNVQLREPDPR